MMLDYLFRFLLLFSTDLLIIPIIVLGYMFLERKIFYHAICLMILSALFNVALKVTFQIPLTPLLYQEGFAFPSGHMQYAFSLYMWLAIHASKLIIKALATTLLIGIGLGLMYFGYHNIIDVLGAVFFGSLIVILYRALWGLNKEKLLLKLAMVFSTCCVIYIGFMYKIEPHVWKSYYALIGILFSEYHFGQEESMLEAKKESLKFKLLATIICFSALLVINGMFKLFALPVMIAQIQWMMVSFFIPFSPYLVRSFGRRV